MAGSMNSFASLMKQYEELTTMIASIQTTMDDVATVLEQILGVLTWKEPRVTFVAWRRWWGPGWRSPRSSWSSGRCSSCGWWARKPWAPRRARLPRRVPTPGPKCRFHLRVLGIPLG